MKILKRKREPEIKVNFVIAGTQKGGTTALYRYLRQHPDLLMASQKEVHFFDNESNFEDSVDYSEYHSFFDNHAQGKLLGEATPIYMYWYEAPKRIWNYNPQMKFIVILRNPIERAYSHWNMARDRGADNASFWEAICSEGARSREALPLQHRVYSYIDRGFYTEQLRRIRHFFPKEQTLVLKSEDLSKDLKGVIEKISIFLDIQSFQDIESKDVHSRPYVSKITQAERDYLRNEFRHEIRELEDLLNWDCSEWLQ